MAFASPLDFHRPASQLSLDRKHSTFAFDDTDQLDDSILESSIMSPATTHRRDSFAQSNAPLFSPETSTWDDFSSNLPDRTSAISTNPFFEHQTNNPFMNLDSSQAATYGQNPSGAWPLFESDSRADTPTGSKFEAYPSDFESAPASFMHGPNGPGTGFNGLPAQSNVSPPSMFQSTSNGTNLPPSPHSNKEWMALAAQEMENRPLTKRMRNSSPPPRTVTPGLRRPDGIRKKNARFDIPAERSLSNIDALIQSSTNEEEKKELKQQKRLLRNRQAALDSRQRKKKHTEELEEEKKGWATRMAELTEEIDKMRMEINIVTQEKERLRCQQFESHQMIDQLNWEKEEMVRTHTLETGELRKKIGVLADRLSSAPAERLDSTAMSAAPSTYTDFANELDHLHMGEWDNFLSNDDMESEDVNSAQQPMERSLIVASRKVEPAVVSDADKPVASGLLLMLLLCGAFVASKSSGTSGPAIPQMPDDVRAASATVLDSIFKDAGVAPTPSSAPVNVHSVVTNHFDALEPGPSGTAWPKPHAVGGNLGGSSTLDSLHHGLVAPTRDQEAEHVFSITPSQYNSLTSADFPARRIYTDEASSGGMSPTSQPSHRRNLAETLAAMREESKGDTAAEVYTRSLLWDKIPTEVVREFKRMVEEGHMVSSPADPSKFHEDRKFAV